jgi:hypothetical protein
MTDSQGSAVESGTQGEYEWIVADTHLDDLRRLDDVLRCCPEIVLGKYVAVTSIDSGSLNPKNEERAAGWGSRGGIAYSPRITGVEVLPREGWDEWWVFENQMDDFGQLVSAADCNIFESPISRGTVHALVNFNIGLHLPEMQPLIDIFWRQFDWIRPQSYLAENDSYLTVVSADKHLINAARDALQTLRS